MVIVCLEKRNELVRIEKLLITYQRAFYFLLLNYKHLLKTLVA